MPRRGRRRRLLSSRQRAERRRVAMRRTLFCAAALLCTLGAYRAFCHGAGERIAGFVQSVQASYRQSTQAQVSLPRMRVYALQLGAYDNGERAQRELERLYAAGTLCMLWQREQMRLVCDAATRKAALDASAARGNETWIVEEELDEVNLRIGADAQRIDAVRSLLLLPDAMLGQLCEEGAQLSDLCAKARTQAEAALDAHPDHLLYTQLAQSLINWCALMENTRATQGEAAAICYARVTLCTLCTELRRALLQEDAYSAPSTASAQRTPSTAAEVMPPA